MTLIPFCENSLWGVKTDLGKTVLSPSHKEITIFTEDSSDLNELFNSQKQKFMYELLQQGGRDLELNIKDEQHLFFLVNKAFVKALLKSNYNSLTEEYELSDVLVKMEAFETFQNSKKLANTNYSKAEEVIELGQYYSNIEAIGCGFFKVKIVEAHKELMPVNEDGDLAWEYNFNNTYWRIINHRGDYLTHNKFSEVENFFNNQCRVLVLNNDQWDYIDPSGDFILKDWVKDLKSLD